VRKHVQLRGPGIRPVLHDGFMTSGELTGHYFPQPWVTSGGSRRVRFDTLFGPRMTWIAIGDSDSPGLLPESLLSPGDTALIENRDFHDPAHELQRCYGVGSLVLVRPDRVVHTHCVPAMAQTLIARNSPWILMPTCQNEPLSLNAASA